MLLPGLGKAKRAMGAVVALALLGVAGYVAYQRFSGEEAAPDDPRAALGFACTACGTYFELTDRALDEQMRRPPQSAAQRPPGAAAGGLVVQCTSCKQLSAVRAVRCPQHGEVIKLRVAAGEPTACSRCGFHGP